MKISTTLLIPALNEFEGLVEFLPKIPKAMFEQIIVVDGQSTDGSVKWLTENGYEVYVQQQRGIRNAYVEVWPKLRGEYVITFSPDGNCKISDLPLLLNQLSQGHDMVIASRYLPPAVSEDDDHLTKFGNYFFTSLISLLFRNRFTDAMTIYRGYRKEIFNELNIAHDRVNFVEKILKTSVGIEPLLSIRAAKRKLSIAEVSSSEPKRMFGQRKMLPFRWGFLILCQVITEFFVSEN